MLIIVWKLATKTQRGERNITKKKKKKAGRNCKLVVMMVLLKHTHEKNKYCQHLSCMLEGINMENGFQAYAYNLIFSMGVVHL